jgi:hypothetical protein
LEIQARKPSQPKWEQIELLVLVMAKQEKHLANMDKVDGRNQFKTMMIKSIKKLLH